jgi:hypothetical protein
VCTNGFFVARVSTSRYAHARSSLSELGACRALVLCLETAADHETRKVAALALSLIAEVREGSRSWEGRGKGGVSRDRDSGMQGGGGIGIGRREGCKQCEHL